jgi:hypothetical protein
MEAYPPPHFDIAECQRHQGDLGLLLCGGQGEQEGEDVVDALWGQTGR